MKIFRPDHLKIDGSFVGHKDPVTMDLQVDVKSVSLYSAWQSLFSSVAQIAHTTPSEDRTSRIRSTLFKSETKIDKEARLLALRGKTNAGSAKREYSSVSTDAWVKRIPRYDGEIEEYVIVLMKPITKWVRVIDT